MGGSYTDNDRSASRHARKPRRDFERLMEDIAAGRGDVLVLWEIARGQRDLAVYVQLRDLVYDLSNHNDRMALGMQAVQAEYGADYIRENVLRGIAGAAEVGRPHGQVRYGYRRIYDSRNGALLRQEPDTDPFVAVSRDGVEAQYTRAGIVAEIIDRLYEGVTRR